jgi:TonB family protein
MGKKTVAREAKRPLLLVALVLAASACAESVAAPPAGPPLEPPPPPAPTAPANTEPQAPVPAASGAPSPLQAPISRELERRKRVRRPWVASNPDRWRSATDGYASSVTLQNQTVLGESKVPFAYYLNGMHGRIHDLFVDFLEYADGLPPTHPLNDKRLATKLEIVLGADGRIQRMGVIKPSGVTEFDGAALDVFDRAQPFGPAPSAILSADGDVYLQWELRRDEVYACSTMNARPFRLAGQANHDAP